MKKKCSKCGEVKSLDGFYRDAGKPDGRRADCSVCSRASISKWRAENPEKHKACVKKWRAENPEKEKATKAKWCAENPEKNRASGAKWRAENPEKVKAIEAQRTAGLASAYVAASCGLKVSQLTPELLELKRAQLQMHRLTKQLNKEIQNGTK